MSDNRMVFYVPGQAHIYDLAVQGDDGIYAGAYGNKTLNEHKETQPTMELLTLDDACARIDEVNSALYEGIKEVTEERWEEMFCVLPPLSYGSSEGATTFLLSEPITDSWYSCYVNMNGKYYEGYSNYRVENIEQRVKRFMEYVEKNHSVSSVEE